MRKACQHFRLSNIRRCSNVIDSLKRLDRQKIQNSSVDTDMHEKLGYELVMFRASNIVGNLTDKNITKLLQIYSDGTLLENLGQVLTLHT